VLRERLGAYPLFSELDESQISAILSHVEKLSREVGPDILLRACCNVVEGDLADVAFALAQEIIEADDEVVDAEIEFLERLEELLTR
jgi:hypothetical protein